MEPVTRKAQQWLRDYSSRLAISYRSSGLIDHCVTKGESRENQILDLLGELLPKRATVERNITIADSRDAQSPKYDAALLDRFLWPRLFQDDTTAVVMIESVLAAIEIKSKLGKKEIDDVFRKGAALHGMSVGPGPVASPPRTCAFAYACDNSVLAFFDFASAYRAAGNPKSSPTIICVLNSGILGFFRRDKERLVPEEDCPESGRIPGFANLNQDALLFFLHFLSNWASLRQTPLEVYRAYFGAAFASVSVDWFDEDYLARIAEDPDVRQRARQAYLGAGNARFSDLYKTSRRSIGLS